MVATLRLLARSRLVVLPAVYCAEASVILTTVGILKLIGVLHTIKLLHHELSFQTQTFIKNEQVSILLWCIK